MSQATVIPYGAWNRRVASALKALRIQTWDDLAQLSEAQLLKVNGFGRYALIYIKNRMRERGVTFQCTRIVPMGTAIEIQPPIRGVYFFECDTFVKIGYAKDIRRRLADISQVSPHPCSLVGYLPTASEAESRRIEADLHKRFTAHRHKLEWFHYTDEIRAYVGASCQHQ